MEIRDNRDKEWFWLDNQYLNGYAKHLGSICTVVYISLCRHADNKTQTCYPSMELIAEENGMGRNAVSRAIKLLKDWRIIEVKSSIDKKTKKRKNNIYTLLSKSEWKEKPCTPKEHGNDEAMHSKNEKPCTPDDKSHAPEECNNNTHNNNTQLTKAAVAAGEEISEVIELFKHLNDEYTGWYKNTTQRKATAYLIEKYGIEKVRNMVTQLPTIVSKKYAPKITSPFELKRDLSKLILFVKQDNQPKNNRVIV